MCAAMAAEFRTTEGKKLGTFELAFLLERAAARGGVRFVVLIDGKPFDIAVRPAKEQTNG